MKLSINWVRDYVDFPAVEPLELLNKITLSVCEVEGVVETGGLLREVVAAEVLSVEKHPDADKLQVVECGLGSREVRVVTGAANFGVGDLLPYVAPGFRFEDGTEIEEAEVRGVPSRGMLCSEKELGFSEDHEGIMILPAGTRPGTRLHLVYPDQVDVICEIDNKSITHRPDLWGHYGFAREIALLFGSSLKPLPFNAEELSGEGESFVRTTLVPADKIPRFSAMSVGNVKVCRSPDKIRHRLHRAGLRAINNLVDLTNYVMKDIGQPMHAFDADRVKGRALKVDFAREGQAFRTLMGDELNLSRECLVFSDEDGPTSLAGIVGGEHSGIRDESRRLYMEAAVWDPAMIRKTGTRHGLKTDAAQHYEKSLDPEMTVQALYLSLQLLRLSCPDLKVCGPLLDENQNKYPAKSIDLPMRKVCAVLGTEIPKERIGEILGGLGFAPRENETGFLAEVPSWRRTKDVSIPEDLIEEIGRVHDYNRIPAAPPIFPIEKPESDPERQFERRAKMILSSAGFSEIYTYPITGAESEARFGIVNSKPMVLKNPVNENQDRMRSSLIPFLVKAAEESQKTDLDFGLFEIGKVYFSDDVSSSERTRLGMVYSSKEGGLSEHFHALRVALLNLFARLRLGAPEIRRPNPEKLPPFAHPHCAGEIFLGLECVGLILPLNRKLSKDLDLKNDPCFLSLDFEKICRLSGKDYAASRLAKYPPMFFDFSLFVAKNAEYAPIEKEILAYSPLITEAVFRDVFCPPEEPGMKSLTMGITFRSPERTLTHDEVQSLRNGLLERLAEKGYELRQ